MGHRLPRGREQDFRGPPPQPAHPRSHAEDGPRVSSRQGTRRLGEPHPWPGLGALGWARGWVASGPRPQPRAVSSRLCPPPCPATTLTPGAEHPHPLRTSGMTPNIRTPNPQLHAQLSPSSQAPQHPLSPPSPLPTSEGPHRASRWLPPARTSPFPRQATTQVPSPISHLPATLDSKPSLVLLGTQPTTRRFGRRLVLHTSPPRIKR